MKSWALAVLVGLVGVSVIRYGMHKVAWIMGAVAVLVIVVAAAFVWVGLEGSSALDADGREWISGTIPPTPGVYVLGVDADGNRTVERVKIGYSRDMENRAADHKTAAFATLIDVGYFPVEDPRHPGMTKEALEAATRQLDLDLRALETKLHQRYASQRRKDPRSGAEWFDVEGRLFDDLTELGARLSA